MTDKALEFCLLASNIVSVAPCIPGCHFAFEVAAVFHRGEVQTYCVLSWELCFCSLYLLYLK